MESDETPLLDNEPVYDRECDSCGRAYMSHLDPNNETIPELCHQCVAELNELEDNEEKNNTKGDAKKSPS